LLMKIYAEYIDDETNNEMSINHDQVRTHTFNFIMKYMNTLLNHKPKLYKYNISFNENSQNIGCLYWCAILWNLDYFMIHESTTVYPFTFRMTNPILEIGTNVRNLLFHKFEHVYLLEPELAKSDFEQTKSYYDELKTIHHTNTSQEDDNNWFNKETFRPILNFVSEQVDEPIELEEKHNMHFEFFQ